VATPVLDGDDEGGKLDQLLIGIGVPLSNRQAIVTGYRSFSQISQNPYNLTNFINTHIPAKLRGLLPLVIQEMFPGSEQESQDAPYFYPAQGHFRSGPQFFPGPRSSYQPHWAGEPYATDPRYPWPAPPGTSEDPQVAALKKQIEDNKKQNDDILGELQAERAERAKERQEQKDNERDAALQSQINAVGGKVDGMFSEVSMLVKGLSEQIQRGASEGEVSRTQQLAEQVGELKDTIASQREERLLNTVDSLRSELGEVRQKLSAEPTGKTTEDLISQTVPLALSKLDNLGSTVKEELRGIRQQAADGKLPNLSIPNASAAKTGDPADPMKTAQQIAGARAIEDRVLALSGRHPRS
jgi:hypothetical protein